MDLLAKMATYVRVIEAGTLSAAAKQLRVSPAAVSRQLTALEADLAAPLLVRTTRKLTVTPAGRRYYERCLRILHDVDEAQGLARATGLDGALRITAPVTFGLASVVPKLRALAAKQPALRLDIRLEDAVVDLVREGIDVALRVATQPPASTEIVAHKIYEWRRVLVASPAYLRRRGPPQTPAALARHDALAHAVDANTETWSLVYAGPAPAREPERVRMNVRCASNAGHVLRDLALDGAGIAMLPPWFVTDEVRAKRLRVVLPGWGSDPIVVHALYRAAHRGERTVRTLVEYLRDAYSLPAQ